MKQITLLCITLFAFLLPAADSRAWVREHAVPLKTAEAGHGFEDMQALKKMVGDARVVSLGEATHGTREFFQLKHRMLEFLAIEMGFTIFSMEANMPEAYRLNEYVLTGKGDPAALLKGMHFWTWDTQEVLAMIEWMRAFNASGKGRVEFTGFDMQTPEVAMKNVERFVAEREPGYAAPLEAAAAMVGGGSQGRHSFGVITYSMPAKGWAGKKIRLSGMIRTEEVAGGAAHLWIRADHEGKRKVFRNLGGNGMTGTSDWKRQSIEVEMPAEGGQVFLGGTFNGSGKVWFDDFTLEVDGAPVALANPGFESATQAGYYAGGADTLLAFDAETFAGGKQSLRMERQNVSGGPDIRVALARWFDVVQHLEANRGAYGAAKASSPEIEWAIQNARVVRQCLEMRAGTVTRDQSMARNVEWILEQSPKAKVVLWAHNAHVAAMRQDSFQPMGAVLRAKLGAQMVVFGLGFHQGSFQAKSPSGALQDFTVGAAPAGSWDALMASAGAPLFALDLRQAPAELRQPVKARTIGAMYSPETAESYWVEADMPGSFDGVLFVENTTAAHKNKSATFLAKGEAGSWVDADTGVRFALPEGWAIAAERRLGTAETSIALRDARREAGTLPALYYRVEPKAVTRTAEETEASLRSAMTAKPGQRQREGMLDYRNRPESVRRHEVNGQPALSWTATFRVNGQAMMESCTYIQSGTVSALFFAKMPATEAAAFEERWAAAVSSLRLP